MARPVYSIRIYEAQGVNGTVTVTPSATNTIVLRDVDVYRGDEGLLGSTYRLVFPAGQTVDYWFHNETASTHQWRGRQVLAPGESFQIITTGPFDVTISGYSLTPT